MGQQKIDRIDVTQFTRRRWEQGSVHTIIGDVPCKEKYLTSPLVAEQIRKFAIGWCPAEHLAWKPKHDEVAIMCFKDGEHFWFHLRVKEFKKIWKGE